jgi:acyl-CoA oxidase
LRGPVAPEIRAEVEEVFADALFTPRYDLAPQKRFELTYHRMRRTNEKLPASRLRQDPALLACLLATAALVDPALCHSLLLHHCLCTTAVVEYGRGRLDHAGHLAALDSMSSIGAFLITEMGRSNSHIATRTEAVFDPRTREFVLHTPDAAATKFPTNTGLADVPRIGVVYARVKMDGADHGVFPFSIALTDGVSALSGVVITPVPGTPLLALDGATVAFDQARVPYSNWLRDDADISPEGVFHDPRGSGDERLVRSLTLARGMWTVIAALVTRAAQAGLTTAIRHSHQRTTQGRLALDLPLIRYRTQQRALFTSLAEIYGVTLLTNSLLSGSGDGETGAPTTANRALSSSPWIGIDRARALLKVLATRAARRALNECRERSGALGTLAVNRFVEYEGLASVYTPAGGDNLLILLDAGQASSVVGPADDGPEGASVYRQGPRAAAADLLDAQTWLSLAIARETSLRTGLKTRLERAHRVSSDSCALWNDLLPLAREVAEAEAWRLVVERYVEAVRAHPDQSELAALCGLYVLDEVMRHTGQYLLDEVLTPEQVRILPDLVNQLCERILPAAHVLVDAFEVPEHLVGAQIGWRHELDAAGRYPRSNSEAVGL